MLIEKDSSGKDIAYPFGKSPTVGYVSTNEDKCIININLSSEKTFDEAILDLNQLIDAVETLRQIYWNRGK
jgi:hypothetical protein